ncbi:MAG: thiol protease/hemagglutinin PrtT [Bacteroidales bacterium]|nr:thiol protease/hemagglutinin PrtT [Bacteroidales bacterium]
MKKTLFTVAFALTLSTSALAKHVGPEEAVSVATHFWNRHHPAAQAAAVKGSVMDFPTLDQLHIVDFGGEGFVIVPADDRIRPILAYAFDAPFPSTLNADLSYWLNGYNEQIAAVVASGGSKGAAGTPSDDIGSLWNTLLGDDAPAASPAATPVAPLLHTRWDQTPPYNQFCPVDPVTNERTVVGCVATAMAQIMKYWNYPTYGQGEHSYEPYPLSSPSSLGTLSADFGRTTYRWSEMPDAANAFTPLQEAAPAALLSYHCGVAVEMGYGPSSSGGSGAYSSCGYWASYCATRAFTDFFKYDPSIFSADRSAYSDSAWMAEIDAQLLAGRPIYYSGRDHSGGHAFVLDGSDTAGLYHFNWGWSGYGNGFYTIDNLAPGTGGAGGNATYTFNLSQAAIFNIFPGQTETFDTVAVEDSTCTLSPTFSFFEYDLPTVDMDTLLHHLDTVFRLHLHIINSRTVTLQPNYKNESPLSFSFCPRDGFVFPECPFRKPNHIFAGWCHSKTGDEEIYQPGQHIDLNKGRTFYALWIDMSTLAIESSPDNLADDAMTLWPNPNSGELHIDLRPGVGGTLLVIDAMGRTVLREECPNTVDTTAKISLESLPAGAYTVQLRTEKGICNKRIIKL